MTKPKPSAGDSAVPGPEPTEVARRVVAHFRSVRRDLPWRRSRDPYAIWVSEIMLQQTRVAAVVPYFERWMARFPTIRALAEAPLDDVLAAWAGLGYYSRARNLHRCARAVMDSHGGALPVSAAALRGLPGIGPYTAGAIASIAFGQPEPLVDGNVARVLARVYAIDDAIKSSAAGRVLWRLAAQMVPTSAPGDFNQGLMELGATVCTPLSPACLLCPLSTLCRARAQGREHELPRMPARRRADELPLIDARALWIERRGKLLLARRTPQGLYGGLWELPQVEAGPEADAIADAILATPVRLHGRAPVVEHCQTLTHRRLRIRVFAASLADGARARLAQSSAERYERLIWQPLPSLAERGLSAATQAIIRTYRENHGWTKTHAPSSSSPAATS
ncbi:MAG TPA: A/G-specific adenine glycosylase [Haliangium sp.]|nr:A/G-specific adenine glycosylase [Haliangium sp.]